jgi:hypothetical protein
MPEKAPAKERRHSSRRSAVEAARQYSLFAASVVSEQAHDLQYFHRQAALCERLLSSVHQPELCDRLASLQAEFGAAALACADGGGGN